jgi:hypothetical protein
MSRLLDVLSHWVAFQVLNEKKPKPQSWPCSRMAFIPAHAQRVADALGKGVQP